MSAQNVQRQKDKQAELHRDSTAQACSLPNPSIPSISWQSPNIHPHGHVSALAQEWRWAPTTCSGSDWISRAWMSMHIPPRVSDATCPIPQAPVANIPPRYAIPGTSTLVSTSPEHTTLARDLTIGLSIMPKEDQVQFAPVALGRDPRLSRTCCMAEGRSRQ